MQNKQIEMNIKIWNNGVMVEIVILRKNTFENKLKKKNNNNKNNNI